VLRHLDHIVYAAPDLMSAVEHFGLVTGVEPVPGMQYVGLAIANYLVGLGGDAYLEIIGPDPDPNNRPVAPRQFGIDQLVESKVVTWAIHPPNLNARIEAVTRAGYSAGLPDLLLPALGRRMSGGGLVQWRNTRHSPKFIQRWPTPQLVDPAGVVPFLVDWGDTPAPPSWGLPSVRLMSVMATHPAPDQVQPVLDALGVDLPLVERHQAGFTVVLEGLHGAVVWSNPIP
jgi:hypothetical protein